MKAIILALIIQVGSYSGEEASFYWIDRNGMPHTHTVSSCLTINSSFEQGRTLYFSCKGRAHIRVQAAGQVIYEKEIQSKRMHREWVRVDPFQNCINHKKK